MTKVIFDYNLDKDAWSWVVIAKDRDLWGLNWKNEIAHIPADLLNKILKLNFKEAQDIVAEYIKENPNTGFKSDIIKIQIIALRNAWKLIEEKHFKVTEVITQKPIYTKNFTGYFTSGFMCPYNEKENWFMVSMWRSLPQQITTICHEIMHLQFLHYYKKYLIEKGLNNKQIEALKEAITFLLNETEFKEIILVEDVGYPEHKDLRNILQRIWRREKNFDKFLDKAIKEIVNSELG